MIADAYLHSLNQFSAVLLPVLSMTLVKSILLFAIVALLIRVFNITSVRTKYVLWVGYIFSTLLIAIYTVASPTFSIPFLQISPHRVGENTIASNLLFPHHEAKIITSNHSIKSATYLQQELKLSSPSIHWSFWILCGWIGGTVLNLFHALFGRIGVGCISRNASQSGETHLKEEVSRLSRELGITRAVRVMVSCRCRLPFTYSITHPVLVVPYEAKDWPASKRRTILIHELSHIRRHDYLILTLSRFICSVFWFIPVTWIAHAYLQLEQEKLCDSVPIEEGERPTVYARYMIDLARTARSLVLWSGIFFMKRRSNMLEKRVVNVLCMKRSLSQENTARRKSRFLSILTLILVVLVIAGSCATGKRIISNERAIRQFEGVYVNNEYSGYVEYYPQKRAIHPDGRMEVYLKANNKSAHFKTEYTIDESWSDSAGAVYSTVTVEWTPGGNTTLELWKLDKRNDTLEVNFNFYSLYEDVSREYPTRIDPDLDNFPNAAYNIWYRQ